MGGKRKHGQPVVDRRWAEEIVDSKVRESVDEARSRETGAAGEEVVYIARVFRHRGRSRGGETRRRETKGRWQVGSGRGSR